MLSNHFRFAYRTMRCFAAAGANVHVQGGPGSQGLRLSRFCSSYQTRKNEPSVDPAAAAREINVCIDELDIDLVISGDPGLRAR